MTDAADSAAACGKVWDSPTEVAGRRKQKHNNIYSANNHEHIYITVLYARLWGCNTHFLLCSMHVGPAGKRRESTAVRITECHTHHWRM